MSARTLTPLISSSSLISSTWVTLQRMYYTTSYTICARQGIQMRIIGTLSILLSMREFNSIIIVLFEEVLSKVIVRIWGSRLNDLINSNRVDARRLPMCEPRR